MSSLEDLRPIAERFALGGPIEAITGLGAGNVNDTFLVRVGGEGVADVVLQRLNTRVFPRPELVMRNLLRFSEHVSQRLRQGFPALAGRRWEVPRVYRARTRPSTGWLWRDPSGGQSATSGAPAATTRSPTPTRPGKWASGWACSMP